MKHIITEAELRFLLSNQEIDEKQLKKAERLETCASVLRALRVLYPEKLRSYFALFLVFSILNPLEHKLITPLHPQEFLLIFTIATNCIGLAILKYNGAEWITTCLNDVQLGLLPPVSAYRSGLVALAATLFLLPGVMFSLMGTILLIPPLTTLLAIYMQRRIINKFE
ncbi:FxsA family protein [Halodesulfovibrio marinisediminis]|uniref:FxsA membrane protein n=1 Tax=Halodesulfovibrio marinisediminis DSM 17456 TaxID=1121457 RepID=A0A1N6ID84_9BACT|nr:FxsA family protein [Halodesulfovibrio marinisediminis]SIO29996.1 FxsA membrane protein [Halodesulfovibrio marinisediminis DSM 17456]